MTQQHAVFGKGSKFFITISSDNRVRLWDVDSHSERRCFVEKHHLSHSYTCAAWAQSSKDDLGRFAVGSSDGVVIIWDLTRGVVSRTIGKPNESPVPSDIAFSKDMTTLFVSYPSSSQIDEFNISDGQLKQSHKGLKKGTFRLASSIATNALIAASGSIKLFDMDKGTKQKLNRPFSSGGAACISFSDCGRYFVCAGSGVGEVLVYDTQNLSEDSEPLAVIPVSGTPIQVVARQGKAGGGGKSGKKKSSDGMVLDIICVLKDKEACVVRLVKELSDATSAPTVTVAPIASSASTHVGLLSAAYSPSVKEDGSIVVAIGSASSPRFAKLSYLDMDGTIIGTLVSSVHIPDGIVVVSDVKAGAVNGHINGSVSALKTDDVSLVGPYEMGAPKRPLVLDDDAARNDGSKRSRVSENNVADVGLTPASKGMGGEFATLEERLRTLSSALEVAESRALKEAAGSDGKKSLKASLSKESIARPTSDSLVMLVEQALQSGDDGLLEQCLQCGDVDVVTATARRLPANRVVALLRRLVAKFEKRPTRGILVTRWILAVLKFHVSFLLSVPDLAKQLAGLSQMLEQRLSTYTRLASLAGRLDLLMAQHSAVKLVDDDEDAVDEEGCVGPSDRRRNKITLHSGDIHAHSSPKDIYYEE